MEIKIPAMTKKIVAATFIFLFFVSGVFAQDSLTIKDVVYIRARAVEHIEKELRDVLNSISSADNQPEDVKFIKENSYSGEKRIFLNNEANIENDLDPASKNANSTSDVKVEKYLGDIDLFYSKSSSPSIFITNVRASNPKKGSGYIFVKVYYSSFFSNEISNSDKRFTPNNRVAEIKIVKKDNKWMPYIQSISFFDPKDTANDYTDDVLIINPTGMAVTDSSYNSEREKEYEQERIKAFEEQKALRKKFDDLIDKGDKARDNKDFTTALIAYNDAKTERPFDPLPNKRMQIVKRMQEEASITREKLAEGYARDALNEEKKRNYEKAVTLYNKAMSENPDLKSKYESKRNELNGKWVAVYELRQKFEAGVNYKDLVDECTKAIKKNETNSDLYLERAKSYEQLGNWDKAIKDCDFALQYDNTNLPALKLRAEIKIKRNDKGDLFSAGTDYKQFLTMFDADSSVYELSSDLRLLIKADDYDKAIKELDGGIAVNPKWANLYYKKGILLDKKNDSRSALKNFSLAITNDSSYTLSYFERGKIQLKLLSVDNAALDFEKARNKGLDSSGLRDIDQFAQDFSARASDFFSMASPKTDSAIKMIDYALALNPNNPSFHYKRGQFYIAMGNNNEAIVSLTRATELSKNYTDAWYWLGKANFNLRKFENAIRYFKTSSELGFKNYPALQGMADSYFELKDYNNAAQNYEAFLVLANASKSNANPTTIVDVYNKLGKSYFLMNETDPRALDAFKTAIKKSPEFAEALFNRGLYFHKTNDLNGAIEDIEKAVSFSGGNPQWNFELARVYYDKRDFGNAVRVYNVTISQDTLLKYPAAIYQAGVCNNELKDYAAALKNYNRMQKMALDKSVPSFNYELANIHLNLNNTDSASFYLDKAYAKDSTNGNTLYSMAIVQLQKSKPAEALVLFERAFKTGQLNQKQIKNDRLLIAIKDDKNFKGLLKKYF